MCMLKLENNIHKQNFTTKKELGEATKEWRTEEINYSYAHLWFTLLGWFQSVLYERSSWMAIFQHLLQFQFWYVEIIVINAATGFRVFSSNTSHSC